MPSRANNPVAGVAVYAALAPGVRSTCATGPIVDLISDAGVCFAVQQVGAISEDVTWTGYIEESSPGSSLWYVIREVEFAPVDAADNVQTITFRRTKRYVRYVGVVDGTDPLVSVAALIGEQKKTF